MKKKIIGIAMLVMLATAMMAGCAKSEFAATDVTEKTITVNAQNADKGMAFMTGNLEVAEGETITITPSLTQGTVELEFVLAAEEQSAEEMPETDGEAAFTAEVSGSEAVVADVAPGSYMVKGAPVEKATGTIAIEVK